VTAEEWNQRNERMMMGRNKAMRNIKREDFENEWAPPEGWEN